MSLAIRSAPSGPKYSPLPGVALVGYAGSAPAAVVILPAGHPPGFYDIPLALYVRTIASGGNLNTSALSWAAPGLGLTSVVIAPAVPTTSGPRLTVYRSIASSGLLPITYTLTPTGITGAPVMDFDSAAILVGRIMP